ncbi:MAG: hypothetical protein ACJ75J_09580 [Cytophagaceae bacterium]
MDEKLIFYIAVFIIYTLYQGYRKFSKALEEKKKSSPSEQQNKPVREFNKPVISSKYQKEETKPVQIPKTGTVKPPATLEELIRQLSNEKSGTPPVKKRLVEKYEDKPVENTRMTVDNYVDEEDLAVDKMGKDRKAAEDLKKERLQLADEHLAPYTLESRKRSKYAEMLKDPESLKAVFVAGEIFRRKF